MFNPYVFYYRPIYVPVLLVYGRPRFLTARMPLVSQPNVRQLSFGYGPKPVEPLSEFFAGGHTIGGPGGTGFRGVRASRFPTLQVVLGSGAPLAEEALGIAGSPIGWT